MSMRTKSVLATMAGVAAIAATLAAFAATPVLAQGQQKEMSDKSVATLMEYAWTILPSQTRLTDRTIKVDKKTQKKETMVPVEIGREVIKIGYTSAQAQLCEMLEDQVVNYDAMIRRERNKKTWTDPQLLYITYLHMMTIHMAAGKLKVVDKPGGEQQIVLEAITPSKDTCTEEKRARVKETILAFHKSVPPLDPSITKQGAAPVPPPSPPPSPAAVAPQPVPASAPAPAKDAKK